MTSHRRTLHLVRDLPPSVATPDLNGATPSEAAEPADADADIGRGNVSSAGRADPAADSDTPDEQVEEELVDDLVRQRRTKE